ncbi:MAG: hypothetical protein M3548_16200 [Actinomycetota bacterium]|nr:hypothetical protein [Actinomycetota bacterium]
MSTVREFPGGLAIEAMRYRLEVRSDKAMAWLSDENGVWAGLRLLAAVDTLDGPDETTEVGAPEIERIGATIRLRVRHGSSRWDSRTLVLDCHEDRIDTWVEVRGDGRITDVHLLSGRGAAAGFAMGTLPSTARFASVFSPNPADPARVVLPATECAVIGVTGDGQAGRGHWFFTPAPLCYAVSRARAADPAVPPEGAWLAFDLVTPVSDCTFTGWHYIAADGGFGFRLDYEGHTAVDGEFRTPTLRIRPGLTDPYAALRGQAPRAVREIPDWWREPMFCGWGAQCHLAAVRGGRAAEQSTQDDYDAFLAHLARHGVHPGTVVVDDKWQRHYSAADPDPRRWPDLSGWIARRHADRQKVLLWWKAWDPEGAPASFCVRDASGRAMALDPEHPGAVELMTEAVHRMLSPDGLDADGLKVDFTANTPTGSSLLHHGSRWGVALLHELLAVLYRAAKQAKPDALVITQTPSPLFAEVTDAVRLNDMLRLDDPDPDRAPVVTQMRYRAAVVAAACPELLVDTDDWCAPDLTSWRAYLAVKADLGVPALYYATHIDRSGEALTTADFAALRRSWAAYRTRHALPPR